MKPLFQSFVLFVLLFSLNAQAYNSNGTLTVNGLARTFVFHSAKQMHLLPPLTCHCLL
ncbi:MAG: hypothetical protein IPN94_19480 [Sphingobacteriales bacterium]|nr:hypothetical protein [Sphingobacteriales bacterium]